jgi:protein required for attachment to host cells
MSMTKVKVEHGDWVVVCDGKKALVLENAGDEKFLNLKTREVREQPDLSTHEQGTDAPGRAISSDGRRSAVAQTDWHDQSEQKFLHTLVDHLETELHAGKTKAVVMVAPPRALGMLRKVYTSSLRGVLRAEIEKDLVKMPLDEIEKHLVV